MKILLVNAVHDPKLSQYSGIGKLSFFQTKGFLAPLSIATIAALTPDDIEVDMWDEPVHGYIDESTDFKNDYDLVAISSYIHRIPRAKEIAQVFRKRGIPVGIGGNGVSCAPEQCRDAFDILFIGEGEYIWPQFIADWKAGNYRNEYRQITKVDLADSPLPRWDGLDMNEYLVGAVQTTRGCPYDCEFCDVIYLFGRSIRHKPIEQVLQEVTVIQRLGMRSIFLTDDNFNGDVRYAKDLLRELISLNRTFERPLAFLTQFTVNLARDEKLLELVADANFAQALMGIESPNKESLKETNKLHNLRGDLVEDCKKIMSYGIPIKAALIAGFDHDDVTIFDQEFEFLQETCIPIPTMHILEATVGTRLWARLYKEGRIVENIGGPSYRGRRFGSNIIPKQMSRVETYTGYANLVKRVFDWNNFATRVKGMVSLVKRKPNIPNAPPNISETDLDRALFLLKMAQRSGMMNSLTAVQGRDAKGLELFRDFFLIEDETARNAIFDIIRHTVRNAPFMLDKVMKLIVLQYGEWVVLQPYLQLVYDQIEAEKSGEFVPKIAQGVILVPERFKKPYKEIFPEIHKRVYLGLKDKTCVGEALIEVFTDFIIRWGRTFEQFEEYHKIFLQEIADRTIAKENSAYDDTVAPIQSSEEVPDVKKTRLADEILKHVEQKLRGIQFADSENEHADY